MMFWFKIRGGTLLEMTSLLAPQLDCVYSQCWKSFLFLFFLVVFAGLVLGPFLKVWGKSQSSNRIWCCHGMAADHLHYAIQPFQPKYNKKKEPTHRYGPRLSWADSEQPNCSPCFNFVKYFLHFSFQFQTKYQKLDHRTMIKGTTQTEK